jgi:aminopeptidase
MDRLGRYADLIVRVGANVQPGQTLFVNGQVEHAELARALARAGYEAGARYVDVRYGDQHVRRAMIEHADDDVLIETPAWLPRTGRRSVTTARW